MVYAEAGGWFAGSGELKWAIGVAVEVLVCACFIGTGNPSVRAVVGVGYFFAVRSLFSGIQDFFKHGIK